MNLHDRITTMIHTALSSEYKDPEAYEQYVQQNDQRRVLARQIADRLPGTYHSRTPTALDIAAGTGIISSELLDRGFEVTAVDVNAHMLAHLSAREADVKAVVADFNQPLPLPDNHFDIATSVWANRYITNTDLFLAQTLRVLKPNGVFVWPIFPIERPIWKYNSGWNQPTASSTLSQQMADIGFCNIDVDLSNWREQICTKREGLALHKRPIYLTGYKPS